MISNLQNRWGDAEGLQVFMRVPLVLVKPHLTMVFMFLLYLSTDSLIAFKSSILTCFGFYIITFLKLLYKDGRPFWVVKDVKAYSCAFDFAGPSYHLFTITFFWAYNIVMYCMKYAEQVNYWIVYSLSFLLTLFGIWVVIAGLYTGSIFIY